MLARCLIALALVGCASAPTPVDPNAEAAVARRRRRRRRPVAPAQCDALQAESRATVARALGERPASTWPLLAALDQCVATPGGAWGLHVDALAVERDPDTRAEVLTGTFSLVHVAADGTRASVRPWSDGVTGPEGNLVCAAGDECVTVGTLSPFDYDGDGEPEVFVRVATERHGAASTAHGRVWSFRDGAVDVYAPSRPWVVAAVRDVDGDGRPDLLTHERYVSEAPGPCGEGAHTALGPLLAVHSLADGGFRVDDAAAKRADRERCPRTTDTSVVATTRDGAADVAATFERVVCARLWGASADAVRRRVEAGARALRAGGQRCAAGAPSDVDVLLEWARQAPPVDLRTE